MEDDLRNIYIRVGDNFATSCKQWFSSEDSLKALHHRHLPMTPFDQTHTWNIILRRELQDAWDAHGTGVLNKLTIADIFNILSLLPAFLDFNILTQVYCNLQPVIRYYYSATELTSLEDKYINSKDSVFSKGAKMRKVATQVDADYNRDLSTLKALRTLAKAPGSVSFRVTPVGSTPAFADSANYSTLGEGGDKFLAVPLGFSSYTVNWDHEPNLIKLVTPPSEYEIAYITTHYHSKSGGIILNNVMWSRCVASVLIKILGQYTKIMVLPRMNSVLLIIQDTPRYDSDTIKLILDEQLSVHATVFSIVKGPRPIPQISKPVEEESTNFQTL